MPAQDTSLKAEISQQLSESYTHVIEKLEGWLDMLITNLPNFIVAILVFAIAYFLSGLIRRQTEKILKKYISIKVFV